MESVVRINGKTTNFGAERLQWTRYGACLGAIAVQRKRFERSGREINGIPFQDKRCLGRVSQTKNGRRRTMDSVSVEDSILKGLKGRNAGGFRG